MKNRKVPGWLMAGAVILAGVGYFTYQVELGTPDSAVRIRAERRARDLVERWPEPNRYAAQVLIDRYGPPNAKSRRRLQWEHKGPWKRLSVNRDGEEGMLEHVVSYPLGPDEARALLAFDPKIGVNQLAQELSARGSAERLNLLTLNLADEVARGRRSPAEARALYEDLVLYQDSGRDSPYLERLLFAPPAFPRVPARTFASPIY